MTMKTEVNRTKTKLNDDQYNELKKFEADLIQTPTSLVCAFEDGEYVSVYDNSEDVVERKKMEYFQTKNVRSIDDVPKRAWPLSIIMSHNVPFIKILSFSSGDLLSFAVYNRAFSAAK